MIQSGVLIAARQENHKEEMMVTAVVTRAETTDLPETVGKPCVNMFNQKNMRGLYKPRIFISIIAGKDVLQ